MSLEGNTCFPSKKGPIVFHIRGNLCFFTFQRKLPQSKIQMSIIFLFLTGHQHCINSVLGIHSLSYFKQYQQIVCPAVKNGLHEIEDEISTSTTILRPQISPAFQALIGPKTIQKRQDIQACRVYLKDAIMQ